MKRALSILIAALPLAAGAADEPPERPANPADPFENFNRGVFAFNESIDKAVLVPVATGYRKAVPEPVRLVVGNFFGNVNDAWSAVNHFLQGKPQSGLEMTMRVATNTVIGIGGLLDVATEAGLERQEEDFGQTLGKWGFGAGPYLVIPLLGPSSVRDAAGLPLDRSASPSLAFKEDMDRFGIVALNLVDTRARYLSAGRLLDEIALDRYSFLRDAYLTRRRSQVHDGEPPESEAESEGEDGAGEPVAPPTR
jgi:phospholipid-binding lipoprotein MlaA